MIIESLKNSKVKEWMKLKEKKYRDETGMFLIEGDHLIKEAEKMGLIKEYITTDLENKNKTIVSKAVMKKISSQITPSNEIAVCYKKEEEQIKGNIIVLDGIQDPGNLGTIIRSAVAFSYQTLILSSDSVDVYNEKVIRSTEGMMFQINIIRKDLNEILPILKKEGYTIYGTNVIQGTNIKNVSFASKKAIIIGNEGNGMKDNWKPFIDQMLYIPMNQKCESLNAAISASIIMYESGSTNE